MFKNYIFDFGNVLADFDTKKLTLAEISDRGLAEKIEKAVFDRKYWDKLDAGTITDGEIKEELKRELCSSDFEEAVKIYDNWVKNLTLFDGMLSIVKELKNKGKKLYLLSNISKNFREKYPQNKQINEILSLFDGLVFSGEISLVKPDSEIFYFLFEKYDINPKESVFIDDNIANINGAKAVGLNTYHYDFNINNLKGALL